MHPRPKIEIKLSHTDQMLEIAGWIALGLLWIITVVLYMQLPDTIPTHFNAAGEADDHGDKMTMMFLPVIATLSMIGMTVLNKYPHHFNFPTAITEENVVAQYTNATRMIRFLKLTTVLVMGLVVGLIYSTSKGASSQATFWFLPLVLGLILIPLGYFTYKAFKTK
jgi:uncharacterized membrane protein